MTAVGEIFMAAEDIITWSELLLTNRRVHPARYISSWGVGKSLQLNL